MQVLLHNIWPLPQTIFPEEDEVVEPEEDEVVEPLLLVVDPDEEVVEPDDDVVEEVELRQIGFAYTQEAFAQQTKELP